MKIKFLMLIYVFSFIISDCFAGKYKTFNFIKGGISPFFRSCNFRNRLDSRMYSSSSFLPGTFRKPISGKVRIEGLNYSINGKQLFDESEFSITTGDKVTIVGENGVGKSTFLEIISGKKRDYDGKVLIEGSVGYLPQTLEHIENRSVLDHIIHYSQRTDWKNVSKEINSVSFNNWIQEFNCHGGHTVFKTLAQMKLRPEILKRDLFSLSGGEKIKTHLCALYHQNPDILLLDEPTNHLDEDGTMWLERYLKAFDGGIVMVTHDRALINKTCNRISELSPITHKFMHFRGDYNDYLKEQDRIFKKAKNERAQQEEEMKKYEVRLIKAKNTASFSRGNKQSDGDKLSYNARGQRQQKGSGRITNQLSTKLEDLKDKLIEVPKKRHDVGISLETDSPKDNLEFYSKDISKIIGNKTLFKNININLKSGDRLIVRGSNGTGKTTFLDILAGNIKPDEGAISYSKNAIIGLLDQEQEGIDLSISAVNLLKKSSSNLSPYQIIKLLDRFGIYHRHDLEAPLVQLSIGCRRKAQLASIVVSGANVLLLDEPTNHMDIRSLERIEDELLHFPGIVIAVTHDRYFAAKLATKTIKLGDNK